MDREQAWALLTRYNQGEFHLRHARTLEGVMRHFANELGLRARGGLLGDGGASARHRL